MNRRILTVAFMCVAAAQFAVPLSMIASRETTLREGRAFKFRTAPVDPYDAFRGRYVAVRPEAATASTNAGTGFERGQRIYAVIGEGPDGFAAVERLAATRPERGDYIRTRVSYVSGPKTHLDMPFDRYYMNEEMAPEAERAYRQHSVRTNRTAYLVVKVLDGACVLESLNIDGRPIEEFLREP